MRNQAHHKAHKSATKAKSTKASASVPFDDESAFAAAYKKRLAEIEAVPESNLAPVNVDVDAAVTTVLGTVPEVTALRDSLTKLPGFDIAQVDGLADYARAAGEANWRYLTAVAPHRDLSALKTQALGPRAH